ncbi:MmcQ/YjbR family DNA-binding protein [Frigoriglobus tundricola]|uniref:DifB protein n=1 Tax=Frigoriglobus tundricola TaxID=2774151 RepID=A0A6M5YUM4_9BACT|nr:MmcQ/YjbR family DNA-binding protein [Frigoriglobus tundricola]QJW97797.1 DifB protein [Frigoriglobus tundricola]
MPAHAPDPLESAETFLRARALKYPEASEDFPWGHRAIKVKAKLFVVLARTDDALTVTLKLPESNSYALMQRYAEPTGYGLGKSGWVSCRFRTGDEPPLDLLEEWVEESYRAVAPKKLILALNAREAGDPEPPPPRPKRGPKKKK